MAFNPFHTFRKHQKTMFAGLTIVCMLTFVLSSGLGRGDFFSYVTDRIGYRSVQEKDKAALLYGQVVSSQDVNDLQRQRTLANVYMRTAIYVAHNVVVGNI